MYMCKYPRANNVQACEPCENYPIHSAQKQRNKQTNEKKRKTKISLNCLNLKSSFFSSRIFRQRGMYKFLSGNRYGMFICMV